MLPEFLAGNPIWHTVNIPNGKSRLVGNSKPLMPKENSISFDIQSPCSIDWLQLLPKSASLIRHETICGVLIFLTTFILFELPR